MSNAPFLADSLSRIPGRGAVSVVTWLAPLVPATGAILYVTASSPSWTTSVTIASLIAIAAMGPPWWLLRRPLQRLPRSVNAGLICVLAYGVLGLYGGLVVTIVLQFGPPDTPAPQMLSTPALLLTSVIMIVLLSSLIAVSSSWYWDLQRALRASRVRRKFIGDLLEQRDALASRERRMLSTSLNDEVIVPLTSSEAALVDDPVGIGDTLESLAGSVIRPLSHRFYADDYSQLKPLALVTPKSSEALTDDPTREKPFRSTLNEPLQAGIPVGLLVIVSIPGSFLIALTDPSAAWWVPPVNLLSIAICLFGLAAFLRIFGTRIPPGWMQWFVLTALYSFVGIVAGTVLAFLTRQSVLDLVVTGISFHLLTGLLASAGRTWWLSSREEQRRYDAESLAMRRDDARRLADARQLRMRAAMILHSQVHTRLLAISSLLAGKHPDPPQALDNLRSVIHEVLIPLRDDVLTAHIFEPSVPTAQSLEQTFPGTAIAMAIRPDHTDLSSHPLASIVSDLIIEAVANAIRHGKARTVTIDLLVEGTTIFLSVTDDGTGLTNGESLQSGLGLSVLNDVSRDWTLSCGDDRGAHLEAVLTAPRHQPGTRTP